MRKLVAGLVAGALMGSGGAVWAATGGAPGSAVTLAPNQAVTYAGLTCTAYRGTTATNASIVCVRDNLRGYGIVVSQDSVVVAKRVNGTVKVLFKSRNR